MGPLTPARRLPRWTLDALLATWFVAIGAQRLAVLAGGGAFGFDGRLYREAARAWLAGGDPWSTSLNGISFGAPPPTLLAMAPFALLPEPLALATLLAVGLGGTTLVLRRLGMPVWFLFFPPLVDAAWNANPEVLLLPLLMAGVAGPAAAGLVKAYALVPTLILGRWRSLVVAAIVLLVSAPLLPWGGFIAALPEIGERFRVQSAGGMGASAWWPLIPVAAAALILADRDRAAWLAVSALWPWTQWYYATIALPGLARRTPGMYVAAALLATPMPGLPVAAAAIFALERVVRARRRLRAQGSRSAG